MKKYVLYMHGGSANHGCEAIINSTSKMLNNNPILLSANPEEDKKYSLGDLCEIRKERCVTKNIISHIFCFGMRKILADPDFYSRYQLKEILHDKTGNIFLMVGGDNYCYDCLVPDLISANSVLTQIGKTVLWGCSIEPELLEDEGIVKDLKKYSLIFARESLTYSALLQAGFCENAFLFPDPAFSLNRKVAELPRTKGERKYIGINISPMIIENERIPGLTLVNFRRMIEYIINETDYCIMFVPHVVRNGQDDREIISMLSKDVEPSRQYIVEDADCETIKGYISQCQLFIGARTHSTIAAYSSMVPTLVVGYSVKSKGIAKDIFGTYEKYVLPVQEFSDEWSLCEGLKWLIKNQTIIREKLEAVMPGYIEKARSAGAFLGKCINRENEDIEKWEE